MAVSSGLLRYHPANSFLHRADALSKSLWVILVSIGVYLVTPPQFGLVILLMLFVCAIWLAQMPLGTIVRSTNLIFALGSLLFVFHSFVQPGISLLRFGPLSVSDCGVGIGLHYLFTLASVVVVSLVFTWTTDVRDLMAGLVRAGFPFQLAFAIFLMFRFMPLMQQEIETVRSAHAIRGHAAKTGLRHRFYLWQRYMFTVLVNGLRKAEQSSIATECRAFGAAARRTELREHHWSRHGLVFLGIWLAVFLAFILLQGWFPVCSVRSVII